EAWRSLAARRGGEALRLRWMVRSVLALGTARCGSPQRRLRSPPHDPWRGRATPRRPSVARRHPCARRDRRLRQSRVLPRSTSESEYDGGSHSCHSSPERAARSNTANAFADTTTCSPECCIVRIVERSKLPLGAFAI